MRHVVSDKSLDEEHLVPGVHDMQRVARRAVHGKLPTTMPGPRIPPNGHQMTAQQPHVAYPFPSLPVRDARSANVVALDGTKVAELVSAARVEALLEYVDSMIKQLPIEVPISELKDGAPDVINSLVEGLRKAGVRPPDDVLRDRARNSLEVALKEWEECTPESCEIDVQPGELTKALQRTGVNPPAVVLTDLVKALRASGVDPPDAVLRELATAFLVEELLLRDLMDGLVVKSVDVVGYESESVDYPEGVMLPTSWPAPVEEKLFEDVESALRSNGVPRWEAGAILSALRGDEEEDIFKTSPDRVLRDLRWALRGARLQLTPPLLRDLAMALREAGVQPRDPLVHDLAMALEAIEADVTNDESPPAASKIAWLTATEEARRLSSQGVDAWRFAAKRIREATDGCVDECDLADAYITARRGVAM